ncbi:hypothetical protein ACFQPA_07190 [Halomarina halobia]|uniref:DUF7331 family protein n=1 Tax=Halomarina halobia TaxID=3033386 RepID=UPI0023E79E04|nr:hypothetical protein [Halomarina sp. PSR21]
MADNDAPSEAESIDESRREPDVSAAVESTETYETDEGLVFYDAQNPLAWILSRNTIRLDDVM